MASSLYKAQFALKICEEHDRKELHAYCKTCQKKICTTCIKEEHASHDWETIADILREKKHSLPEECKVIRAKELPCLRQEIKKFDRKIQDEDASFGKNKSVLNGSRQNYIDGINKIFDYKIDDCQRKSETAKQIYREKREGLNQKVEFLDMMTTSLDKDINTLPDHDILDMEKEMRNELEKALSYSADKYACTTVFIPGEMDVQTLENMIGDIHSTTLEEMYDIGRFSDATVLIKPVSETIAWVRVKNEAYFKLLDRTGEEIKVMNAPCTDLVIMKNGDFVISNQYKNTVSVLSQDEVEKAVFNTKPLRPTFISSNMDDNLLVTLTDDGDHFNLVPTSRRIVQRMTLTGKVLQTYEFKEDGKTRLFTYPRRTAENKNNDLCIINAVVSQLSGELVVLHKYGRENFTYRGEGLESEKFYPHDVECDTKCRILLTEGHSRAIYMLSPEGMHLCTLCQYKQIRPYAITLNGDYLWCGCTDGSVKVFFIQMLILVQIINISEKGQLY